jgi:hypothetical protein
MDRAPTLASTKPTAVAAVARPRSERISDLPRCVITLAVLLGLVVSPMSARAVELSGGISLGGVQAGVVPRLAVSPNLGILWRMNGGLTLALHDLLNILPPINNSGLGIYNHMSAAFGYAWENGYLDVGPSFSIYSMVACGTRFCGKVTGLAPGGQAQVSLYLSGPLGASVSATVDWIGGRSLVLPGGVAAMVVAGPVVRWGMK